MRTARLAWRWSERDEHRTALLVIVGAVALGLVLRVAPRDADVMHTFEHRVGLMAPTCGLTRGGLALLRGEVPTAWAYNPAIFPVALLTAALLVRLAIGVAAGRWLNFQVRLGWVGRLVAAALLVVLWLNQQAHFARLAR